MKIGIITAMPEETGAVLRAAAGPTEPCPYGRKGYRFGAGNQKYVLTEAGMGMVNAATATRLLVEREGCDVVISAGFGGGVLPGMDVGAVVLAEQVFLLQDGAFQRQEFKTLALGDVPWTSGTIITASGILEKKGLGDLLPQDIKNPVVDMESAAVAAAAAEGGIFFLGVRAISDPWDEELSFSIEEFCDASMTISIPRVLSTVVRRPRIIPQLVRLARNSRVAAASLSDVFGKLFRIL